MIDLTIGLRVTIRHQMSDLNVDMKDNSYAGYIDNDYKLGFKVYWEDLSRDEIHTFLNFLNHVRKTVPNDEANSSNYMSAYMQSLTTTITDYDVQFDIHMEYLTDTDYEARLVFHENLPSIKKFLLAHQLTI